MTRRRVQFGGGLLLTAAAPVVVHLAPSHPAAQCAVFAAQVAGLIAVIAVKLNPRQHARRGLSR